jgi:hypothetical protein
MTDETEKSGKNRHIGGFVFAGCVAIGLAMGFLFGNWPFSFFIGLGAGFFAMAIIRYKGNS